MYATQVCKEIQVIDLIKKSQVRLRDNGYIGRFVPGDHLEIQAWLDDNVLGYKMHLGRVSIYRLSKERSLRQKVFVFADRRAKKRKPYLRYNQVTIRLLLFLPQGKIALWSLGLALQKEDFFLVCQKNHEENFFMRHGQLICPTRQKDWPDVCRLVDQQAQSWWLDQVPPIPRDWTKIGTPSQIEEVLRSNQARVIWWDELRGRGVARLPAVLASQENVTRDVIILREDIKVRTYRRQRGEKIPNLKSLRVGQIVEFKKLRYLDTPLSSDEPKRAGLSGIRPIKAGPKKGVKRSKLIV